MRHGSRIILCLCISLLSTVWALGIPPRPGVAFPNRTSREYGQYVPARNMTNQTQATNATVTRNLAPRGLVILVSFKDSLFKTDRAEIDSMLNGLDYERKYTVSVGGSRMIVSANGSLRQYFSDQSSGQYVPRFDVIGPVQLSRTLSYYGANTWGGSDKRAYEAIRDACSAVDKQVDFSQYDNDKDGEVDFVYILYAGYAESDGAGDDYIWPHSSSLSYFCHLKLDGKYINTYACSSEMNYVSGVHNGIGTIAHEFSHVLGLPDLYDTSSEPDGHKTLGLWDIMDSGAYSNDGNTPVNYSAYERFFMGWTIPRLLTDSETVTLNSLQSGGGTLLISPLGSHNLDGLNPAPSIFYLLENRQRNGWDKGLPGHGMLMTKINFDANKWNLGTVNDDGSSMGVDIIEADGVTPSNSFGKGTDAFPSGSTEYTEKPPFDIYPIRNIRERFGAIIFDFMKADQVGIETIYHPTEEQEKFIHHGRMFIRRGGYIYDLMGHPITRE